MAETIMKNWGEAMRPQPTKTDESQTADQESPKSANRKDPEDEADKKTGEGEFAQFDPHVFSALMEEISGNFCEALKTMGGKRRASSETEKQADNQPHQKQSRFEGGASCSSDRTNAGPQFDFANIEGMMKPMMDNFMQAMGGQGHGVSTQEDRKQEGNASTEEHQPSFEEVLKPWAEILQNFAAGSQNAHTVASQGDSGQQGSAPSTSPSSNQEQEAAKNVLDMMSGMFQQFGKLAIPAQLILVGS